MKNSIPKNKLKDNCYYLGIGRNSNIGLWNKENNCFLTIGNKWGKWTVKYEPYETYNKCFIPFKEIKTKN